MKSIPFFLLSNAGIQASDVRLLLPSQLLSRFSIVPSLGFLDLLRQEVDPLFTVFSVGVELSALTTSLSLLPSKVVILLAILLLPLCLRQIEFALVVRWGIVARLIRR